MFLFSGTVFPLKILPGWAMKLALILPLTHVSSLVRGACLGQRPPCAGASVAYLLVFTAVAFAGALLLMRRRLVK
jgi:ABC-type polysaccharide/polyol phosphate export permease